MLQWVQKALLYVVARGDWAMQERARRCGQLDQGPLGPQMRRGTPLGGSSDQQCRQVACQAPPCPVPVLWIVDAAGSTDVDGRMKRHYTQRSLVEERRWGLVTRASGWKWLP